MIQQQCKDLNHKMEKLEVQIKDKREEVKKAKKMSKQVESKAEKTVRNSRR